MLSRPGTGRDPFLSVVNGRYRESQLGNSSNVDRVLLELWYRLESLALRRVQEAKLHVEISYGKRDRSELCR